jgi:hypothetical protein
MAKYYVESGNLQMVVHAESPRAAAIWVIHRTMSQLMPFMSDESRRLLSAIREPIVLAETVTTNECGFGRGDGITHDTFAVVSEWNRLMLALDKLQAELTAETTAV